MNLGPTRLLTVSFCTLVLSTLVAVPIDGKGKNVKIDKNDQTAVIECTGNAVTVTSDDNKITLKGECSKLTVKGKDININAATVKEVVVSGTDVNLTVANVAAIKVTGNDVNVLWGSGIGGKMPKISVKKGNDINVVHIGK